jgi:hypothetical protein
MKSIIKISTIVAINLTLASADDLSAIPMAKTYPMDYKENPVKKVDATKKATSSKVNKATPALSEIEQLKEELKKLKKKVSKINKKASQARTMANGNHLKWDVDFRTTMDSIDYTLADGTHAKNDNLFSNRLLLNMKYDAGDHVRFYGTIAYNKVFGYAGTSINKENASFDWLTNENTLDDGLNIREVYWLYSNDTFLGTDVSWTASLGRRPSTDGLGANFREGNDRKSAVASIVNIEFDGLSLRWNMEKVIPMEGMWFKLCWGRGLSSVKPRFSPDGTDYSEDKKYVNSDMWGLIFVPYNNGQYSFHTFYAKAFDLIGYDLNANGQVRSSDGDFTNDFSKAGFYSQGDLEVATAMFKADGIGDGINDFLDDTIFFTSYSVSKTDPKAGHAMLGSVDSESGYSYWIGTQMPCPLSDDGRLGFEFNHGDKYWRSVTYAEDTLIGSKVATRGDALEAYWIKPLTKSLSMSLRYTHIDYDYTGSNGFFGGAGTPMKISDAKAMGMNPVEEAEDVRLMLRYKY